MITNSEVRIFKGMPLKTAVAVELHSRLDRLSIPDRYIIVVVPIQRFKVWHDIYVGYPVPNLIVLSVDSYLQMDIPDNTLILIDDLVYEQRLKIIEHAVRNDIRPLYIEV